jgi:hypothetical protein
MDSINHQPSSINALACPHCQAEKPARLAYCRACLWEIPWLLMRDLWDAISKRSEHAQQASHTAIRSHLSQHSSAL